MSESTSPGSLPTRKEYHLVSHTHWDREWYHPESVFRVRLVRMLDDLLEAMAGDPGLHFLLDGQSVLLEDYLEVRPERRGEIAALLASGRLEAGPWFVLSDELTLPGEVLIRNLLAGRRTIRSLGGMEPPVLYSPDTFGHPATLPVLAVGFQLPIILLWRGFGGSDHPRADTFWWKAPAGERALVYHLPAAGYEVGSELPTQLDTLEERWLRMRAAISGRNALGVLLIPNGADHHSLQRRRAELLPILERVVSPDQLIPSSLSSFGHALLARAQRTTLPEVGGELRDSYGYAWTLQGTFGSRLSLKRLLSDATYTLLQGEAWNALARRMGSRSQLPLLQHAWKRLLLATPHDTICGTSADEVARDASGRLADALETGREVAANAIASLAAYDTVSLRDRGPVSSHDCVLLRNPVARRRWGVAEVTLRRKLQDVPVGPGSGSGLPATGVREAHPASLFDRSSGAGPLLTQTVDRRDCVHLIESPHHYPDADLVEEERLLVWVPAVPGLGLRSLQDVTGGSEEGHYGAPAAKLTSLKEKGDGSDGMNPEPQWLCSSSPTSISNGIVQAARSPRGEVVVSLVQEGSQRAAITLQLCDTPDLGDLYTPSLRHDRTRYLDLQSCTLVEIGPLRATLLLEWGAGRIVDEVSDYENVISPLSQGEKEAPLGQHRADPDPGSAAAATALESARGITKMILSIIAGEPFVRMLISRAKQLPDNRMGLQIRSDMEVTEEVADSQLSAVRRTTRQSRQQHPDELAQPLAPLQRYVSLLARQGGFTLLSANVGEYSMDDNEALTVTLHRAVGELSRNNLTERPGHAGWPVPTPGAQEPGAFTSSLALMPHHTGGWDEIAHSVERAAEDFLLPLTGETLRGANPQPAPLSGVELHGTGLAVLAIKEREDGTGTILRCVNLTRQPQLGEWRLGKPTTHAWLARLDESEIRPLTPTADGKTIPFESAPHQVVTISIT